MKILIIGQGYIARRCYEAWGGEAVMAEEKVYSAEDAERLIDRHRPDAILNAAGVRGKPNVDWCETHPLETVLGNVQVPIMIAEAAAKHGTYLLHIGSGCVFYGPAPEAAGWKETDHANPSAVYSRAKYAADLALSNLPNVGIARIRLPIDHQPYPGNLIDKLASYHKIIDVENSVTIIADMVRVFYELLGRRARGIFHVTNPGTISHREIMRLYREFVDPAHTNEWISEMELVQSGLAVKARSNNFLQSINLERLGIVMRPVHEALVDTMKKYAEVRQSLP